MGRLEGQVAIVTGGGQGIGAAISSRFAQEGARVVVAQRTAAGRGATRGRHPRRRRPGDRRAHGRDRPGPDRRDGRPGRGRIRTADHPGQQRRHRGVRGSPQGDAGDLAAAASRSTSTRPGGRRRPCCRTCSPTAAAASSTSPRSTRSRSSPAASRIRSPSTGSSGLTRALAAEYSARGVRVNAICPGYIESQNVRDYFATFPDPAAERARAGGLHAIGRIGVAG